MLGTQALFIFILLCFLGSFLASAQNVASITALLPCTDPAFEYQGYTYSYQEGGYKAWSHCKIFHPDTEPELCGVSKVWSDVYICDPDRLLFSTVTNSSFGDEMGDVLQSTVDTLLRDCPEKNTGTSDANSESVVIAVLLLEALKTSDSSSSGLCMNSCGEIMPTYENSSQATAEDHDTAAYNFAQQLISNEWVIGQCDNQVLLLYVEQQNKLHIYSGDGATKRFGDSMLQETFEEIKGIVENKSNQTELGEAMLEGVVLLASTMRPGAVMDFSSPSVIMLAAFLACLVLLIVGISIFIFGNSKDDPE